MAHQYTDAQGQLNIRDTCKQNHRMKKCNNFAPSAQAAVLKLFPIQMFTRSAFRNSGVLILLIMCSLYAWGQQPAQSTCQVQIDEYTIPLLWDFTGMKPKIPLEEDVEIVDPNQWRYFYSANIIEAPQYTITPEVDFEGSKKDVLKITKYSFNYVVEIARKDMKDAPKIITEVFKKIDAQLPFLKNTSLVIGERKRISSDCGICSVSVARPRSVGGTANEIEINIDLTPQASAAASKAADKPKS